MPTENRSSDTETVSDSEMTECQFHNNCGAWCETPRELEHNLCEHCLEAHDEEMTKPAEQHQGEPVGVMRASSAPGVAPFADIWPWLEPGTNLYTRPAPADAGEVERLRAEVKRLDLMVAQADFNYDSDRHQFKRDLGERDALLVDAYALARFTLPETWHVRYAALSASAEPSVTPTSVPDGYCLMPKQLTAENGAKALLLGEFKLQVTRECPECLDLEEPLEGCEICDGEGEYAQRHTIPWDQIKYIYSVAVKGLAIQPHVATDRKS